MKTYLPLLLILVMILASCGDKKPSAQNMLYDSVMVAHDEIMVKASDIMKYKKMLKNRVEKMAQEGADSLKIVKAELAIVELDKSHEAMMHWMHGFDNNFEGKVNDEIMEYLNDQKNRIEAVGTLTESALKHAEEILEQ